MDHWTGGLLSTKSDKFLGCYYAAVLSIRHATSNLEIMACVLLSFLTDSQSNMFALHRYEWCGWHFHSCNAFLAVSANALRWIQQSWIVPGCTSQQVEGVWSSFAVTLPCKDPIAAWINNPCVFNPCLLKVVHGKKIRNFLYLYLELNEVKLSQPTGTSVIQRHGLA